MANDRDNFRIAELQLVDDSRVHHDLAAWHAVGIEFIAFLNIDFPFPVFGIGSKRCGLRNQPVGNSRTRLV
jgi:hypothetical protein